MSWQFEYNFEPQHLLSLHAVATLLRLAGIHVSSPVSGLRSIYWAIQKKTGRRTYNSDWDPSSSFELTVCVCVFARFWSSGNRIFHLEGVKNKPTRLTLGSVGLPKIRIKQKDSNLYCNISSETASCHDAFEPLPRRWWRLPREQSSIRSRKTWLKTSSRTEQSSTTTEAGGTFARRLSGSLLLGRWKRRRNNQFSWKALNQQVSPVFCERK